MKRTALVIPIAIAVIILLLGNLEYMPGPHELSPIARIMNDCISFVSVLGLFTLPVFLLMIILKIVFKESISNKFLVALVLSLLLFLNFGFVRNFFQEFARERVIEESHYLIQGIEAFHASNKVYPDSLRQLVPEQIIEIRRPSIIGIEELRYEKLENTYEIRFIVRYPVGFNYEVVTYNPKSSSETSELYTTSSPNWQYYIVD